MSPYNSGRPTQAVILAGGKGTRLAPLTFSRPKPMVEFHGKVFLEYLIEMLRNQGFTRILLLLGYMPEIIQNYFGDGSSWGVSIQYAVSNVEDDTGRRLKLAEPLLDDVFLLMYCDNYWPMDFDSMWRQFIEMDVLAQVTVYSNNDMYTQSNVRLDDKGFVLEYDKTRKAPNLSGVDIGFILLRHEVIDLLPDENISFEKVVYPQLVAQSQLSAYITDHRYYSIGSLDRLPLTEEFLARRPTVLLDRDGVLNAKMPRAQYVRSWDEWQWLPGAKESLSLLNESGYRVIIISNQAGIARQAMSEAALDGIHQQMVTEARQAGGDITAIYYCPHGWDAGCDCRKPKPGLLFQAQKEFCLDLSQTIFIGDDDRDRQAAVSAGCPFVLVEETIPIFHVIHKLLNGTLARSLNGEKNPDYRT